MYGPLRSGQQLAVKKRTSHKKAVVALARECIPPFCGHRFRPFVVRRFWGSISESGVGPSPVIDMGEDVPSRILSRRPSPLMGELNLQRVEELSMSALPQQQAARLVDGFAFIAASCLPYAPDGYWLPRSGWQMRPSVGRCLCCHHHWGDGAHRQAARGSQRPERYRDDCAMRNSRWPRH